jgi:hypothetical protein
VLSHCDVYFWRNLIGLARASQRTKLFFSKRTKGKVG